MRWLLTLALLAAVIVSALAVVTTQHQARRNFTEWQTAQRERDQLNEEWGRLRLEQSTLTANDRVERIARRQLDMLEPSGASQVFLLP